MRIIERTTQFKRDFKREKKGRHGATLETALTVVLGLLMSDMALAARFRDHALTGNPAGRHR